MHDATFWFIDYLINYLKTAEPFSGDKKLIGFVENLVLFCFAFVQSCYT